jgi:hypothetical protein
MRGTIQRLFAFTAAVALSFGMAACGADSSDGEDVAGEHAVAAAPATEEGGEGGGEHARAEGREGEGEHGDEGHDEGGEEGEESGEYIGKADTWDQTRRGARLVLSFDAAANAFVGRVENTTERTLCAVRVEVHVAGGVELGPTERTDVPAGGTTTVRLPSEGQSFESWTAHPEVSACS